MEENMGKETDELNGGPLYKQALRESQVASRRGIREERERRRQGLGSEEQLTGLEPRKRISRSQAVTTGLVLAALGAAQIKGAASIGVSSASESGPTPRILPAPEDREGGEFEATIKAINQEQNVVLNVVTPTADEIRSGQLNIVNPEGAGVGGEAEILSPEINAICRISLTSGPGEFVIPKGLVDRIDPELDSRLNERVINFFEVVNRGKGNIEPGTGPFRDFWIYAYLNGERRGGEIIDSVPFPTEEGLYLSLASHEERIRSPFMKQVVSDIIPISRSINEMFRDNLNPALFRDGVIPQLPEEEEEILSSLILPGWSTVGAGLGYPNSVMIFGDSYAKPVSDYNKYAADFIVQYIHEAIHSFPQAQRAPGIEGVDWATRTPESKFVHATQEAVEDFALKILREKGLEVLYPEGPSVRLIPVVYVYGVLKEGGKDAFKGLLNSMASGSCLMTDDYEEVRGNHLSWDELFSAQLLQFDERAQDEIMAMVDLYWPQFIGEYMRYNH
ncbi:MAG TPA: hypothetical protein VMY36_04460 [Patescibacteria group bacterium]|nr:hypothetical protein [Patescibacteria group bacterium]